MEFPGVVKDSELRSMVQVDSLLTSPGSPFEVEHRQIRGVITRVWKNQCPSLRDGWLNTVKTFGARTYIVAEGETYTYNEIHARVVAVAAGLAREFNVQKGDRVAIVARNHVEYIISFWAVALLGGVAALVNAFLEGSAIYHCIRDVGCKAAIFDVERYQRVHQADCIGKLFGPAPKDAVDDFGCVPGAHGGLYGVAVIPRAFDGVVPQGSRPWIGSRWGKQVLDFDDMSRRHAGASHSDLADPKMVPEDLATVLFTSGTTGRPKGVCATQRQFLVPHMIGLYQPARSVLRRNLPLPAPSDQQSAVLLLVPLFHSTGIQSCMAAITLKGDKLALMPKYSVDAAAAVIQQHQINSMVGIGFMVRELITSKHEFPSLTGVSFGGSTSAKEIPGEFKAKSPNGFIAQGYGATETNGSVCGLGVDDFVNRPTSTGTPAPVNQIVIMDPKTGCEVPRGQPGELWVSGPNVALGYWGRPEATREVFTPDGFYKSGDIARMDRDGFVYIMDRSKHIIIRGGENISGPEVENAIYEGDKRILDCAAVPVPDARLGEKVAVVCIPKPENLRHDRPTERDILAAAAKFLPKFAMPEFVWIRDEPLERNPSGKVDRAVVKEATAKRYAELQGGQQSGPRAKL
ncbi:uncharacterized protein PFL1_02778 [Pseudozyma flocculosa PF-1]|uniref:Related to 4-coumarate--CoA ligase 1 n=2 Tax=Pseudozyma flocculosa TaxID=84751 RepID=A0A5C3F0S1_9BASI|nr:uncharacterized protein PFL1_02778 [Pseudozyma flocculosa PF-1]EPQ29559.1 hypothetical protein PFL1_02778 [Pseudozyma flocculosa PF-1]SPO38103.1 related to 4-coumarate--CoA ligase 1 [Pseudozyma flocculosa]